MKKTALVLSGGGSRGGYEVGVCKALQELGIKLDIAIGTSVGAINSAMIAQDDLALCENLWHQLETHMIFDIPSDTMEDEKNKTHTGEALAYGKEIIFHGGADNSGLRELLGKYIDENKIRSSSIEYGLVITEYPSLKGHYLYIDDIPAGKLTDYILASASCFPAVRKCVIDDKQFIDGGYYDNMPVEMALNKGSDPIIAVDLNAAGIIKKESIEKARRQCEDFRLMESSFDLGNFLIFDKVNTSKIIQLGYLETLKLWGKYDGEKYIFKKGVFTPHRIKGAESAACILKLDPVCVYDENTLHRTLSKAIEETTLSESLIPDSGIDAHNIEKLLINIKDDLARIKLMPQLLLLIAKSLKEDAENSIFMQPAIFKLLEDEIRGANFLVREGYVLAEPSFDF